MSTGNKKKKTLYGRYDDYRDDCDGANGGESFDTDGGAEDEAVYRVASVRLSDIPDDGKTAPRGRTAARSPGKTIPPRRTPADRETASNGNRTRIAVDAPAVQKPDGEHPAGEHASAGQADSPVRRTVPDKSPTSSRTPRRTATLGREPGRLAELIADPTPREWAVTDILPEGEGETVQVTLEGHGAGGERITARIRLLTEQYSALSVRPGSIDRQDAERLIHAGRLCAAVKKGMELLGYGDMSERRLTVKLTARGVSRPVASEAAAYLRKKGLLREEDAAYRRAEQDLRKLWGPRRILDDLRAQGYPADTAEAAVEALSDPDDPDAADYILNCATLIRRKYRAVPDDREERRKMTGALVRLGYSPEQVREAALMILHEDE